jgi:hypothetical protein
MIAQEPNSILIVPHQQPLLNHLAIVLQDSLTTQLNKHVTSQVHADKDTTSKEHNVSHIAMMARRLETKSVMTED